MASERKKVCINGRVFYFDEVGNYFDEQGRQVVLIGSGMPLYVDGKGKYHDEYGTEWARRKYARGDIKGRSIGKILRWLYHDYDHAIRACRQFYKSDDSDIVNNVLIALEIIPLRYGRTDKRLIVSTLRHALKLDLELEDMVFGAVYKLPRKQRSEVLRQIEDLLVNEKDDLGYMFITQEVLETNLEEVDRTWSDLEFCCKYMSGCAAVDFIEYNPIVRSYRVNVFDSTADHIQYCPSCGKHLGDSLWSDYRDILKKEHGITNPDFINFSNIPQDFKTDVWWKKRGL